MKQSWPGRNTGRKEPNAESVGARETQCSLFFPVLCCFPLQQWVLFLDHSVHLYIRMKKNLRDMWSLSRTASVKKLTRLPHPNANSSELPGAYQLGMGNASPALLRFWLAWSCAGVMHAVSDVVSSCVRWPSHAHQRILTFLSAVLFFLSFFLFSNLLINPSFTFGSCHFVFQNI